MRRRRIVLVGLAAYAVVGFAACSSGSSATKPHVAPSQTTNAPDSGTSPSAAAPTTTATVPTTAAVTTSPPTSATSAGTIPNCTSAQIATSSGSNSGMGHIGVVLIFTNSSAQTCRLRGYPGVAGLNGAGHQVIQAVRTVNGYFQALPPGSSPPVVTLAPGRFASAFVEGTDVPVNGATSCPTYPKLLVTAPNTYVSVTIDKSMPGCSPVQVHPVVPGTTGSTVS